MPVSEQYSNVAPQTTVRDLRRAQIIAAARALVAKDGLQALTISRLERALTFSRGVISYHFKNKADIVDAVLSSAVNEIDRASGVSIQGAPTLDDKLRAMVSQTVRGFIDHVEAGRILLNFWARIPADAHATRVNATLYARYRAHAHALIQAAAAQGAARPGIDSAGLAAVMVAVVIGIVTQWHFQPGAIDVDAAIDEAVRALRARLLVTEGRV